VHWKQTMRLAVRLMTTEPLSPALRTLISPNALLALEALAAIARAGSIRAAADELGVIPTALTRRIARLEARLGLQLLEPDPSDRRRRQMTPTGSQLVDWLDATRTRFSAMSAVLAACEATAGTFGPPPGGPQAEDATETWRVVPTASNYEASNLGRVRHRQRGNVKKASLSTAGLEVVGLWVDGRYTVRNLHVLVAEAFLGPRPQGTGVAHRDGNPSNNRSDNLFYTLAERADRHSKLSPSKIQDIRSRLEAGERNKDIAAEFGVSRGYISQIKSGVR